jgi:hypothetical protein
VSDQEIDSSHPALGAEPSADAAERAPNTAEAQACAAVAAELETPVGWEAHRDLFERLWHGLQLGNAGFGPRADAWKEVGFQRDDPTTDFRGGGAPR